MVKHILQQDDIMPACFDIFLWICEATNAMQ